MQMSVMRAARQPVTFGEMRQCGLSPQTETTEYVAESWFGEKVII